MPPEQLQRTIDRLEFSLANLSQRLDDYGSEGVNQEGRAVFGGGGNLVTSSGALRVEVEESVSTRFLGPAVGNVVGGAINPIAPYLALGGIIATGLGDELVEVGVRFAGSIVRHLIDSSEDIASALAVGLVRETRATIGVLLEEGTVGQTRDVLDAVAGPRGTGYSVLGSALGVNLGSALGFGGLGLAGYNAADDRLGGFLRGFSPLHNAYDSAVNFVSGRFGDSRSTVEGAIDATRPQVEGLIEQNRPRVEDLIDRTVPRVDNVINQTRPPVEGFIRENRPPVENFLDRSRSFFNRQFERVSDFVVPPAESGEIRDYSPALELIQSHEGLRLDPYYDPVGLPTIGYGQLLSNEPYADLSQFDSITEDQAVEFLRQRLDRIDGILNRLVEVPIDNNQRNALASFVYNVGEGNFRSSTLLRELNAGNYEGAAEQFPSWIYARGQQLPGLVTRREDERNLFQRAISGIGDFITPPAGAVNPRFLLAGSQRRIDSAIRSFNRPDVPVPDEQYLDNIVDFGDQVSTALSENVGFSSDGSLVTPFDLNAYSYVPFPLSISRGTGRYGDYRVAPREGDIIPFAESTLREPRFNLQHNLSFIEARGELGRRGIAEANRDLDRLAISYNSGTSGLSGSEYTRLAREIDSRRSITEPNIEGASLAELFIPRGTQIYGGAASRGLYLPSESRFRVSNVLQSEGNDFYGLELLRGGAGIAGLTGLSAFAGGPEEAQAFDLPSTARISQVFEGTAARTPQVAEDTLRQARQLTGDAYRQSVDALFSLGPQSEINAGARYISYFSPGTLANTVLSTRQTAGTLRGIGTAFPQAGLVTDPLVGTLDTIEDSTLTAISELPFGDRIREQALIAEGSIDGLASAANRMGGALASTFVGFVTQTDDWTQRLAAIPRLLQDIIIELTILRPATNFLSDLFSATAGRVTGNLGGGGGSEVVINQTINDQDTQASAQYTDASVAAAEENALRGRNRVTSPHYTGGI